MPRPLSPPPPPYESLQQEFDRKTAQALEASLSNLHPHLYAEQDNYSWENYDEAAFEAAHEAAAMQTESRGGSSSTWSSTHSSKSPSTEKWAGPISSSGQPLQTHKPTPSDPESKESSWLAEAHFAESSTFRPPLSPSTPYGENSGPQPERPERPLVMIAYHDNGSAPPSPLSPSPPLIVQPPYHSRPPSRLILPLPSSPQPDRRVPSPRPHPHRPLLPPARQVTSSAPTVKTPSQPYMVFDHTMAYANSLRDDGVTSPMESRLHSPAEFYNSAVSSHLPTSPSKPNPLPHMRQSQYHSHHRGTVLPNISPTHSAPSFSSYASRSPSVQLPMPSSVPLHPGNAHARWAASEDQIWRDL